MRLLTALICCSLVSCGGDEPAEQQKPETCTPQGTTELVAAADMSELLSATSDEDSAAALMQAVSAECCRYCPETVTNRPLLEDAKSCIQCAATYPGGNPGEHVTGCAATVCDASP